MLNPSIDGTAVTLIRSASQLVQEPRPSAREKPAKRQGVHDDGPPEFHLETHFPVLVSQYSLSYYRAGPSANEAEEQQRAFLGPPPPILSSSLVNPVDQKSQDAEEHIWGNDNHRQAPQQRRCDNEEHK